MSDTLSTKKRKREGNKDLCDGPCTPDLVKDIQKRIESLEITLQKESNDHIIVLNIGGTLFSCEKDILSQGDHYFSRLLSSPSNSPHDDYGNLFIDRDPSHFRYIIDFLRGDDISLPTEKSIRKQILNEADYYGLEQFLGLFSGKESREQALGFDNLEMRRLENDARLLFFKNQEESPDDPHYFLVDVYKEIHRFRFNQSNQYTLILDSDRVVGKGYSITRELQDYKIKFNAFTKDVLKNDFNWNNVFIAGGSAMIPLLKGIRDEEKDLHKYYHSRKSKYVNSDIDIFLYGLTQEEGKQKIREIFDHVRTYEPNAFLVRTSRTVTIVSGYPIRNIQIILRLYKSPAEVLLGFDIDCVSVGYDGDRVYCLPRAIRAYNNRFNMADPTRQTYRTNSYEYRLWKYSKRGFAVAIPGYTEKATDFSLFSTPYTELSGFAKLLFLDLRDNLISQEIELGSKALPDPVHQLENYSMGVLIPYSWRENAYSIMMELEGQFDIIRFNKKPLSFYWTKQVDLILEYTDEWYEYHSYHPKYNMVLDKKLMFIGSLEEYVNSLPDTEEDWFKDIY